MTELTDLDVARINIAQLEREAQDLFAALGEAQNQVNIIGKQLFEKERELMEATFKLRLLTSTL